MYIGKKVVCGTSSSCVAKVKTIRFTPYFLTGVVERHENCENKKAVLKNHIFIYLRPLVLLRINYNINNAICT